MVDASPIAAFDLDGTLIDGQSQAMLLRTLLRRRDVSPGALAAAVSWFVAARLGWRGSGRSARDRILARYESRPLAWLDDVVAETVERMVLPAVHGEGARRLQDLESAGVKTVVVSASLEPVVIAIASALGASGGLGTRIRQQGDRLGAGIEGPVLVGRHKAAAVSDWASRRFESWQLVEAFGDSRSDVDMLKLARRATVVNPDRDLVGYARRAGWNVVEWRKRG